MNDIVNFNQLDQLEIRTCVSVISMNFLKFLISFISAIMQSSVLNSFAKKSSYLQDSLL